MSVYSVHATATLPRAFKCRTQFTVKAKTADAAESAARRLMADHVLAAHNSAAVSTEFKTQLLPGDD